VKRAGITVYWVASDGDKPSKIYFDLSEAMNAEPKYLDGFDVYGEPTTSYLLESNGEYTTDF
jgi:hypothetical protein